MRKPTTPGEILLEEYMKPANIDVADLSLQSGIPIDELEDLIKGESRLSITNAVRLSKALDTSVYFWVNLEIAVIQHQMNSVHGTEHRESNFSEPRALTVGIERNESFDLGKQKVRSITLESILHDGVTTWAGKAHGRSNFIGKCTEAGNNLYLNYRYMGIFVTGKYDRASGELTVSGENYGRVTLSVEVEDCPPRRLQASTVPDLKDDPFFTDIIKKLKVAYDEGRDIEGTTTINPLVNGSPLIMSVSVHTDFDDILFDKLYRALDKHQRGLPSEGVGISCISLDKTLFGWKFTTTIARINKG